MRELKSFSASPPDGSGVVEPGKQPFWGLLSLTGKRRILYHAAFWTGFVGYHLLYFLPAFSSQVLDSHLWLSYTAYYLRFVPVFYLSAALFNRFQRRFSGILLLTLMLAVLTVTMHMVTTATYLMLENRYGLSNLSPAFQTIGSLYLKPLASRQPLDWLVFVYDIQELQLLILPVGIKMVQFGLRQQIAQSDMEKQALRTELMILKSELEPHFVYNVLNAAYDKILPASKSAARYLDKLSRLLRYTLYQTSKDWVSLSAELTSLRRYLELERLRNGRRLAVNWHQEGSPTEKQHIPTLLLVMLAENAIKHGVQSHGGRCRLEVRIHITGIALTFCIENDKPVKTHKSAQTLRHGLGLKNIQRRLGLLYADNHRMEIQQTDSRYMVTLTIPLVSTP